MYELLLMALFSSAITLIGMIVLLKMLGRDISKAIEGIVGSFTGENVSRAMSIIGKKGGDAKAQNAIKSRVAKAFISKNYGVMKIAAEKFLGLDVDELIDDYGAENIIGALREFLPQLGIDLTKGFQLPLKGSSGNEEPGKIP